MPSDTSLVRNPNDRGMITIDQKVTENALNYVVNIFQVPVVQIKFVENFLRLSPPVANNNNLSVNLR